MALSYGHLFDFVRKERGSLELQELPQDFHEEGALLLRELASAATGDRIDGDETAHLQLLNSRKLLRELYDRREQKILLLAQNRARTGSHMQDSPNLQIRERLLFDRVVAVLLESRTGLATSTVERTETRRITVETVQVTEKKVELVQPLPGASDVSDAVHERGGSMPEPIVERTIAIDAATYESSPAPSNAQEHAPDATEEPMLHVRIMKHVPQFYGKNMELFGPYAEDERLELPTAVAMLLVRKDSAEREDDPGLREDFGQIPRDQLEPGDY